MIFENAYFITGTAYAGKSTLVHLLAEKHGGVECEENYHDRLLPGRSPRLRNDEAESFSQIRGRKFNPRREASMSVEAVSKASAEHDAFGAV